MSKKIIHVSMADKFLPPFIDFIQEKFSKENMIISWENVYMNILFIKNNIGIK